MRASSRSRNADPQESFRRALVTGRRGDSAAGSFGGDGPARCLDSSRQVERLRSDPLKIGHRRMAQLVMESETLDRADTPPRNPVTPPPREKPRWVIDVEVAKAKVFEALSPEERAEVKAAMMAARERSEQRKKATLALARQIFAIHFEGRTVHEIAAAVERSADAVIKFARARGVAIPYSEKFVRRAVRLTIEREHALRRMATDSGKSSAQALEDLIAFALDDDATIARRTLRIVRKAANPKKSNRAIAEEVGVSVMTVGRARKATATDVAVAKTVGRDGKRIDHDVKRRRIEIEQIIDPADFAVTEVA
jgi:hypothetical protein